MQEKVQVTIMLEMQYSIVTTKVTYLLRTVLFPIFCETTVRNGNTRILRSSISKAQKYLHINQGKIIIKFTQSLVRHKSPF